MGWVCADVAASVASVPLSNFFFQILLLNYNSFFFKFPKCPFCEMTLRACLFALFLKTNEILFLYWLKTIFVI